MDATLFSYSLSVAEDLAKKYNVSVPLTLSQRDVPGMSRGVVPLLVAAGALAVSVGTCVSVQSCLSSCVRCRSMTEMFSSTACVCIVHTPLLLFLDVVGYECNSALGVNGATCPPLVPKAFRWQDPNTREEVRTSTRICVRSCVRYLLSGTRTDTLITQVTSTTPAACRVGTLSCRITRGGAYPLQRLRDNRRV